MMIDDCGNIETIPYHQVELLSKLDDTYMMIDNCGNIETIPYHQVELLSKLALTSN